NLTNNIAKNFEKRQKIKKEILRKKRVIPSVSFLFKKLKTFLFCLENMG
ncbi:Hypothetical protein EfmE4452_0814, partial [Enterococcus faecium E4452]